MPLNKSLRYYHQFDYFELNWIELNVQSTKKDVIDLHIYNCVFTRVSSKISGIPSGICRFQMSILLFVNAIN